MDSRKMSASRDILSLPVEIQLNILAFLDLYSLIVASKTCKIWASLVFTNASLRKQTRQPPHYPGFGSICPTVSLIPDFAALSVVIDLKEGKVIKWALKGKIEDGQVKPAPEIDIADSPLLDDGFLEMGPNIEAMWMNGSGVIKGIGPPNIPATEVDLHRDCSSSPKPARIPVHYKIEQRFNRQPPRGSERAWAFWEKVPGAMIPPPSEARNSKCMLSLRAVIESLAVKMKLEVDWDRFGELLAATLLCNCGPKFRGHWLVDVNFGFSWPRDQIVLIRTLHAGRLIGFFGAYGIAWKTKPAGDRAS